MSDSSTPSTDSPKSSINRVLLGVGGVALAGLGLAAGLMLRPSPSPSGVAATEAASQAEPAMAVASTPVAPEADAPVHKERPRHEAARSAEDEPGASRHAREGKPAAVCGNCGVVESVRPVQHEGQGSGVGAVAGGVLGGVVGNQMGKGTGRDVMTVLGAIGGGIAGNQVEKQQRSVTVYETQIRMDDGSTRTVTQRTAPVVGTRVEVEGDNLRVSNRTAP